MKIALVVFIITFIVAGNIGYYQAEKKCLSMEKIK